MTLRKTPGLGWESWTDRLVREATERGEFDDLPGLGKPIPGQGDTYDPDWWLKDFLQREDISVLPQGLALRAEVEREVKRIRQIPNPVIARHELAKLNRKIDEAAGKPSIGPGVLPRRVALELPPAAADDGVRAAAVPPSRPVAGSTEIAGWIAWGVVLLGLLLASTVG